MEQTTKTPAEARSYEKTGELIRRLLERLERGAQRWNARGELAEGERR